MDNYAKENIFNYRKGDGIAYLVFYILIPVMVTAVSLKALPSEDTKIIYCYITILISAFNSIYDSANRWNSHVRSMYNTKIFLIMFSNSVIIVYCLFVIMYILVCEKTLRFDWVFLTYFFAIIVSLHDIIGCFTCDMALRGCIKKGVD